jgi:hypothetical protein
MNLNLLKDPDLALDISDLPEFRTQFSGTVTETALNIHILHNHNFWWVVPMNVRFEVFTDHSSVPNNFISTKDMPHVTM